MKSNNLTAYAIDFVSFLIQKSDISKIKNIILFGSVSRGEADNQSDIDIFIDVVSDEKQIERQVEKIVAEFYSSAKYKKYWELLGITNEIKPIISKLSKWIDLNPSIVSNGLILYGKYKRVPKKGKHRVLFIFENIKPNSKRVMLNKKIFGYKHSGKNYKGLLEEYNGIRLGKGCIFVPLEHSNLFLKLFKAYRINVKIKKMFDYS